MAARKNRRVSKASPMKEIGVTGLQVWHGQVHEEFLRNLQGVQWRRVIREMVDNDAIIGAMRFAIEMLMREVELTVEPGGSNREDEERAEYLETLFDDMSHTMADFLTEWMATLDYGWSMFEAVLKRREGDVVNPAKHSKYTDGRIGVRKLAIRHPDTLHRWILDESGGVQAMEQAPPMGGGIRTIPIDKALLFRIRNRKGSPEGLSLWRNCYVSYTRKKSIADLEAIGIERDLAGIPVIYTPFEWHLSDVSSEHTALLEEAKNIVRNLRNSEQAGLALPSMYDEHGNQILKLELLTSGGRRSFDTSKIIERYNREMAMTILADVILLGHERVGSLALASSKATLFAAGLNALLDSMIDVLNRHLVPRLMRLNGWPTENMPQWMHGSVENVDLQMLGEYVKNLSGAGMQLFPSDDGEIERAVLRAANLPDTGVESMIARQQEMQAAALAGMEEAAKPTVDGGDPDEDEDEEDERRAA